MKKKFLKFVLLLSVIVGLFAAMTITVSAASSGTCGDNLTWTLDSSGTLTISGTGDMYDYTYSTDVPWFDSRNSIKSVIIGDSVTTIVRFAFLECDSLTSITIPNSVTTIEDRAFYGCDGLTAITVDADNMNYSSDDNGVLFNKDKTKLVVYPMGKQNTAYEISDGVTTIGNYAFNYCDNLIDITIPDSVTTIGNHAFYFCKNLIDITIPDSVTTIGDYVFYNCNSLTSITIPDGVTTIGEYAFRYCYSLETITIPDSVTTIGDGAFYRCDALTAITVDADNMHYSSDENGVLFNKDKTRLVAYPAGKQNTAYEIPDGVTEIGYDAFACCNSLTNVIIPDSVTTIGVYAFGYCISLTDVTIPDSVTTIGKQAFWHCNSLTTVTIGYSVTSIGDTAFNGCDSLEAVYYTGTEEEWNGIVIDGGNGDLLNATIIFMDSNTMHITISGYDVSITSGKLTGDISLDVFNVADDKTVRAIVAVYGADGKFIGMSSGDIAVSSGDSSVKLDLAVPVAENQNSGYVKVFFWNNLTDLTPYSRCDGFEF